MKTPQNLLILGASTRAAAFSALRAGLAPRCADFFADRDLAATCPVERVDSQEGAEGLERAARCSSLAMPGFSPGLSRIIPTSSNGCRGRSPCSGRARPRFAPCATPCVSPRSSARTASMLRRSASLPKACPATAPGWSSRLRREVGGSFRSWTKIGGHAPSPVTSSSSSKDRASPPCSLPIGERPI